MENHIRVELAATLSELWFDDAWALESGGVYPYVTQENGDVSYTDEAQDCFNGIYSRVDSLLDLYTNLKG
jgi:hypothetical protein